MERKRVMSTPKFLANFVKAYLLVPGGHPRSEPLSFFGHRVASSLK
jgi:hypothetical protein